MPQAEKSKKTTGGICGYSMIVVKFNYLLIGVSEALITPLYIVTSIPFLTRKMKGSFMNLEVLKSLHIIIIIIIILRINDH